MFCENALQALLIAKYTITSSFSRECYFALIKACFVTKFSYKVNKIRLTVYELRNFVLILLDHSFKMPYTELFINRNPQFWRGGHWSRVITY